jgi:hypothetical protein
MGADSDDDDSRRSKGADKKAEPDGRRFPEEEDEDLLRESDDRFVLFPIRYREVCRTANCCSNAYLRFIDMASV